MSKPKFKIGDRVRINRNARKNYVSEEYIGTKGVIVAMDSVRLYVKVPQRCCPLMVSRDAIDFIRPEKIIIYRNGKEIIAKNTLTGKTGVAKCNPADEFNFNTGAKLAFERLTAPEPEKPKYYNGKVVCVKSSTPRFTAGKIYKVDNGALIDNDGSPSVLHYKSLYNINKVFLATFIEFIED